MVTDLLIYAVNIGNARLFKMEEDLGLKDNQFQMAVSLLFVTYCVSLPSGTSIRSHDLTWIPSSSRPPPT